jgi:hypothetical protein
MFSVQFITSVMPKVSMEDTFPEPAFPTQRKPGIISEVPLRGRQVAILLAVTVGSCAPEPGVYTVANAPHFAHVLDNDKTNGCL